MEHAVFAAQKKRVTEQLGEAVFAAVGLMVRQYMDAPAEKYAGQDDTAAVWDNGTVIEDESAVVNESFDPVRYRQLGGEMIEAARESAPHRDERALAEAARGSMRRSSPYAAERRMWERTEPDGDAAAPRHTAAAWTGREEGDLLSSARAVSDEIERDARRYDGGFYLY